MSTKNIVPRFDGEGGIGTSAKKWGVGYFVTPTASDDSNKAATTEFVHDNTDNKLPLAGGTMTGTLTTTGVTTPILNNSADNSHVKIIGGTSYTDSAFIAVHGKNSGLSGFVDITAQNASNAKTLELQPDGTFTWDGKNILTDKVTSSNASDVFDAKTGYSIGGGSVRVCYPYVFVNVRVDFSTAASATASVTVAQLKSGMSGIAPTIASALCGENCIGRIDTNGEMVVTPLVAKASGDWIWARGVYLIA